MRPTNRGILYSQVLIVPRCDGTTLRQTLLLSGLIVVLALKILFLCSLEVFDLGVSRSSVARVEALMRL